MTAVEGVVLAGGLVVILAGLAWAYRYTASPKAGERMAEANRRYRPPKEIEDFDWRLAAKVFVVILAIRFALLFAGVGWSWLASPVLWTLVIMWWVKRRSGPTAKGEESR